MRIKRIPIPIATDPPSITAAMTVAGKPIFQDWNSSEGDCLCMLVVFIMIPEVLNIAFRLTLQYS